MSKMGSLSRFVKENGGDAKRVFIVPNNDLESVVITEMLKDAGYKEGIDFFVTNQSWGASWEGVEFDIWEKIAEQHGDGLIEFAKRNNEERFYQNAKAVDVTEYLFESTSQNFDELIQRLMNSSCAMQQSDFFLTRCPDSIDEIQKMIEEYYNDGGQAEVYVAQTELGWVFSYTTVSGKNSVSLNYIEPSEKQEGGYGLQYFAKSYNPPEKSGIVKSCIENGFEFVSTPEQNLFLSRISDVRNDLFQKYWDELNGVQSNKSTSKIIRPVELVGVELKGSIRDIFPSGCIVSTNVDHHNYCDRDRQTGKVLYEEDRTQTKSSLEQIADMLGRKLTVYEGFVAANDRGFVEGMREFGKNSFLTPEFVSEMIRDIRMREHEILSRVQGITEEMERQAEQAIADSKKLPNGTLVVMLPHDKCATVTDRIPEQEYDGGLLIVCGNGEIDYYGSSEKVKLLNEEFGGWTGDTNSEYTFYGTTNPVDMKKLIEIVDRDKFDLLMDANNNFVPNSNGYDKDEDNLGEEI